MAVITKSIGTAARDYSTIAAWEAASGGGGAGDDCVGECYDDSAFDEVVSINFGTVNSIKLTVPSAERHNGTAGNGARIVRTGAGQVLDIPSTATVPTIVEWLEIDSNGQTSAINGTVHTDLTTIATRLANLIVHGTVTTGTTRGIFVDRRSTDVLNCIVYHLKSTSTSTGTLHGIYGDSTTNSQYNRFIGNTVHDLVKDGGTGVCTGIELADISVHTVQNNISTDPTGTTSGTKACFVPSSYASGTCSNNLSSDTTASGTGSLVSKTAANQFVSTVVGSENLHLKTGADAIDTGVDLVVTPTGVNIDIDGRDRDAQGDTWDIGADEFVAAGGSSIPVFMNQYRNQKAA
jgi:hypothetical protein